MESQYHRTMLPILQSQLGQLEVRGWCCSDDNNVYRIVLDHLLCGSVALDAWDSFGSVILWGRVTLDNGIEAELWGHLNQRDVKYFGSSPIADDTDVERFGCHRERRVSWQKLWTCSSEVPRTYRRLRWSVTADCAIPNDMWLHLEQDTFGCYEVHSHGLAP